MSPVMIVALAAVALVALALGYKLVSQLAASRAQLVREQRQREDDAAKAAAGDPGWNLVGDIFDPLHLLH